MGVNLLDYLKLRNKAANDDDEAFEVIPEDRLTVIDYLVGYQLVAEIDPNLGQIFNKDYSAIYLYAATSGLSDEEILQLANRSNSWQIITLPRPSKSLTLITLFWGRD